MRHQVDENQNRFTNFHNTVSNFRQFHKRTIYKQHKNRVAFMFLKKHTNLSTPIAISPSHSSPFHIVFILYRVQRYLIYPCFELDFSDGRLHVSSSSFMAPFLIICPTQMSPTFSYNVCNPEEQKTLLCALSKPTKKNNTFAVAATIFPLINTITVK